MTLKLNKTIVDVDVFVSDSLKKLIEDSFQTDGKYFIFHLNPYHFKCTWGIFVSMMHAKTDRPIELH